MRHFTKSVLVLSTILVAQAGAAHAKDVCLSTGGILPTACAFKKVGSLKKPGKVSPIHGHCLDTAFGFYAVTGTAYAGNSSIHVAIHAHSPNGSAPDFTASWTAADASLQGTAQADRDGDFIKDDATLNFATIDCSLMLLP